MAIHSQYVTGRKEVTLYLFYVYKDLNILSVYNLCSSIPFEKLTVSPASAYTVSVLVEELVASPGTTGIFMCKVTGGAVTAALASAYALATAVT